MIHKTGKPSNDYCNCLWFIDVSLIGRKCKFLFIVHIFLFFSGSVLCQYPGNNFFKERIISIYNSPTKTTKNQLRELLQLRQQIKEGHFEKDSSFTFLLQKIGVLYSRQLNYTMAIDFTNESIRHAKECIGNNSCNTLPLVDNYYNLFYYYSETGQLENEYDAIDSCIAYVMKGSSGFDMAIDPLDKRSEYLFNKGEYSMCSKDAKLGEEITKKYYHGKDSINYIVIFATRQANALYFAKNFYNAEKLLKSKILQFEQTGNNKRVGAFYVLLGLINRDKQNYTKALFYFRQAYHAHSSIRFKKGCAIAMESIGTLYAKNFHFYDTGLKYCTRALKYADATDSLLILRQTGNIYVLKSMYDKAQYFFQQAYNTVQPGINETTILQNSFEFPGFNLLQYLSDLTTDKANAYVQQYYYTKNDSFLKKALSIYKKADLFLAKIKIEQQLEFNSNLIWRTTARNLYEHALEACYANNNIEDAFYFFEKSRATLLNDQVNEQRWMADTDITKQAGIKKTIIALERNLAASPALSEQHLAIQKQLYTNSQELNRLIRNIKTNNPLFYKNYLDTVIISIPQLRKNILNNSKTLVEIFTGDDATYVLTVTSNKQSLAKINKQLYDSLTNTFNSFVTSRTKLNSNFKGFIKTAHGLYNLLFQNIVPSSGSIIVSPDGVSYPFEALITNEDDLRPDYFLNKYAVSYAYSVKYLTNQFVLNTNNSNSVLGMAPVTYNHQNLATLTGSDVSLKEINDYFSNVTNFVFEKATRNNFLQNFSSFSIVQLYTHAADTSMNNDPVIYFADSALFLSDLIPERKPVTQLVILSACETANGKLYQGEGIFSFNRAFAALGIPAAISNLWSIENESTYRITEHFFKYISQGIATDVALQKAKLEFINNISSNEKKLPYFWAGSILTGKVDIIKSNPGSTWKKISMITGLIILIAYIVNRLFLHTNREKRKYQS